MDLKIEAYLEELIAHWSDWNDDRDFYINELIPDLLYHPERGDEKEQRLLNDLKAIIATTDWHNLPELFKSYDSKRLDKIKKQLKEEENRKKKKIEETAEIEKEKLLAQKAAERDARIEAEAIEEFNQWFNMRFLEADSLYEDYYSDTVSKEKYKAEKISFVRAWVMKNLKLLLDDEQAAAIASFGKNLKVVARAGSGKTRTLVTKAIFLHRHCQVPADSIMLLAFNKKAVLEIEERLKAVFGKNLPWVMTFHSLAYSLVHPEEKLIYDEPDINQYRKSSLLQTIIDNYLREESFFNEIGFLMTEYFSKEWNNIIEGGYNLKKDDFLKFRRSLPHLTLKGERVSTSFEKLVADTLITHDIKYYYKKIPRRKLFYFEPDFIIPRENRGGIIIECIGPEEDVNYDQDIERKIKFFKNINEWKLIVIDKSILENNKVDAEKKILTLLQAENISTRRITDEELWEKIKDRAIGGFSKAVVNFIQRCRKTNLKPQDLNRKLLVYPEEYYVEKIFAEKASILYNTYLEELKNQGLDDFDGLIERAINLMKEDVVRFKKANSTGFIKNIKYLLIDEFQDFSQSFYKITKEMANINPMLEFFFVGDDWQSINRFAGSDLEYFLHFKNYYSNTDISYIKTNYRSMKKIVDNGNGLMEDFGKKAIAKKKKNGNIYIGYYDEIQEYEEKQNFTKYHYAVVNIIKKLRKGDDTVVLLSRTNFLSWKVNDIFEEDTDQNELELFLSQVRSFFPKEIWDRIKISTIHRYKGLQSDIVIVLDAFIDKYPLIHDHWIFNRILGDSLEEIINEERRLFYVALTRAVHTLVVLTDKNFKSNFIEEQNYEKLKLEYFGSVVEGIDDKQVVIKVTNRNPYIKIGTFQVKEKLKNDGFKWDEKAKAWIKFSNDSDNIIEELQGSDWGTHGNELFLRIEKTDGIKMKEYEIEHGKWLEIY